MADSRTTVRVARRGLLHSSILLSLVGASGSASALPAGIRAQERSAASCDPLAEPLEAIRPKQHDYEAWPHLLTTPGGAVLCGYTARAQHLTVKGSASVLVRSEDGGVSWEQIAVRRNDAVGWGFEAMAVGGRGEIIAIHSLNSALQHDKPEKLRIEVSWDDGRTFQEKTEVDTGDALATLGDLTYVGKRTLLAPYHGDGWGVVRSQDDGETWEVVGTSNGGKWPAEGRIITGRTPEQDHSDATDLLMVARNPEIGLLLTKSTDRGATWKQAESTGLGTMYEGLQVDGELIHMVLADRDTGEIFSTASTFSRLWDDATDWDPPCLLTSLDPSGAPAEQGYPDLARVDEQTLLMAAYDGENPITDIRLWRYPG